VYSAFVFDRRGAAAQYEGIQERLETPLAQLFERTEETPPERRRFELFTMRRDRA
jgi:hypothetical protein